MDKIRYKKRGDISGDPKEIAMIYLRDKEGDKSGYDLMRAIKKAYEPSEAKRLFRDLMAGYIAQSGDFDKEIKAQAKAILGGDLSPSKG